MRAGLRQHAKASVLCPISPAGENEEGKAENIDEDMNGNAENGNEDQNGNAENINEELEEQGQEEERDEAKTRKDPGQPTREEINRHNITHLPYRSWCPICVKAKGKIRAHLARHELNEDAVPTVTTDYFYMGIEGEEGTLPMIIIKDTHTKCIFTHVIREKRA